jgi:NAD(P)-dependent dehydrogenase (short-subunit alcohol dehydrogenase family)
MTLTGIDLTSAEETGEAFATIGRKFESIVTLINVAGGFAWETGEQGSIETWDRQFSVNLRTTFNATTAALPLLLKHGGSIVNVAAAAALRADLGMGAYAASKSAVLRLTESFAVEFKDRGIRVNAVLPSVLDTVPNRAAMPDADVSRWVSTEALASVIAFLASDASRAVTGALLPVMGRL